MPVRINGATSGYVELAAPAVAGSTSLTLPATSGTIPMELGYAAVTTNSTMLSTTQITYLTLTIAAPGTPIMVEAFLHLYSQASAGLPETTTFSLYNSNGTALVNPFGKVYFNPDISGYSAEEVNPVYMAARITPTAGTITLQVRAQNVNGASQIYAGSTFSYPSAWIRVTGA